MVNSVIEEESTEDHPAQQKCSFHKTILPCATGERMVRFRPALDGGIARDGNSRTSARLGQCDNRAFASYELWPDGLPGIPQPRELLLRCCRNLIQLPATNRTRM